MHVFHPQARTPTQPASIRPPPIVLEKPTPTPKAARSRARTTTLITGATGFIGGACTIAALESGQATDLLFLVRAESQDAGLSRVLQSLSRFEPAPELLAQFSSKQIILGDFADVDQFGDDPRLDHVTHVLNCAAVASFGDHPGIWPINVVGTVAFAKRMAKAPLLKRFVHVGTAMACGPGQTSPVQECWKLQSEDGHLVLYTASKAEAELQMHAIPGLPLVVARPSIVVGHSQLGCKPSTSIFWVFRLAQDLGRFMCGLDQSVDVIPVDYCAKALLLLLFKEHISSDLYHISAGTQSATFREIELAMAQARGIEPLGDAYEQIDEKDIASLMPEMKARLGLTHRRLVTKAMKLYGGFSMLSYQFDNSRLIAEGAEQPPSFPTYIGRCIQSTEGLPLINQMMDDFK